MKIQSIARYMAVAMFVIGLSSLSVAAQTKSSEKIYEQMSRAERAVFISAQMKRLSREISGTEYQLTPEFEQDIQKAVSHYASRLERSSKSDLRLTLEAWEESCADTDGSISSPESIPAFRTLHPVH